MKKAAATYSNRQQRRRPQALPKLPKGANRVLPRWVPYTATVVFAAVLCLTINFRAFTELNQEVRQNESLQTEIEKVTSENLNLQEEIYYLQNDSSVIEREARKFGFRPADKEKKVPVPAGK